RPPQVGVDEAHRHPGVGERHREVQCRDGLALPAARGRHDDRAGPARGVDELEVGADLPVLLGAHAEPWGDVVGELGCSGGGGGGGRGREGGGVGSSGVGGRGSGGGRGGGEGAGGVGGGGGGGGQGGAGERRGERGEDGGGGEWGGGGPRRESAGITRFREK